MLLETPTGTRISGTVDPDMVGEDGRIYVTLSGQGGTKTFEAFPVFDEECGLESSGRLGFSMRLADGALPAGEYSVSLSSGGLTQTGVTTVTVGDNQYQ